MATSTKPAKRVCEGFMKALRAQYGEYAEGEYGPMLVMDWDWSNPDGHPSIVWEGGPYEWAITFPHGGVSEETGYRVPDVSAMLPEGWYAEAITGWAVGIYRI